MSRPHTYFDCGCNRSTCPICEGGLYLCEVCGGAEVTLLPECRQLSSTEEDTIAKRYWEELP